MFLSQYGENDVFTGFNHEITHFCSFAWRHLPHLPHLPPRKASQLAKMVTESDQLELMFQRPAMKVTELPADTVDGSCEILHQAGYPLVNIQKTMVAITIL
jgi:hypothetical protein